MDEHGKRALSVSRSIGQFGWVVQGFGLLAGIGLAGAMALSRDGSPFLGLVLGVVVAVTGWLAAVPFEFMSAVLTEVAYARAELTAARAELSTVRMDLESLAGAVGQIRVNTTNRGQP